MGGISSLIGSALGIAARAKAGEAYKRGFEDARNGSGKNEEIIRLKMIRKNSRFEAFDEAEEAILEAYEEGYRDGFDRERLEKSISFWNQDS